MLQRVREAVQARVNLVHRLDRGASGCLLFTYAATTNSGHIDIDDKYNDGLHRDDATAILQAAMNMRNKESHNPFRHDGEEGEEEGLEDEAATTIAKTRKTYLCLVRGECTVGGRDLRQDGWFTVNRPIRDEKGILKNATTDFRWIAGQDNDRGLLDRPRASLVLARPNTGRWHQIRRHLNGLSAPIIGDSTHGHSKTNREWREKWGLIPERTCLHLLHLQLPATPVTPRGVAVTCPLAPDMTSMIQNHLLPQVLEEAERELNVEGLSLWAASGTPEVVPISLQVY